MDSRSRSFLDADSTGCLPFRKQEKSSEIVYSTVLGIRLRMWSASSSSSAMW